MSYRSTIRLIISSRRGDWRDDVNSNLALGDGSWEIGTQFTLIGVWGIVVYGKGA